MFLNFFFELKQAGIPVSVKEYLTFLNAVDAGIAGKKIDDFYYLSRAALVKDERNLDKFDRVFGHVVQGPRKRHRGHRGRNPGGMAAGAHREFFTEEEKQQIEALGGLDKIMETLKKRLDEQKRPPPGRIEMDRHRRHLAVRRLRL